MDQKATLGRVNQRSMDTLVLSLAGFGQKGTRPDPRQQVKEGPGSPGSLVRKSCRGARNHGKPVT